LASSVREPTYDTDAMGDQLGNSSEDPKGTPSMYTTWAQSKEL